MKISYQMIDKMNHESCRELNSNQIKFTQSDWCSILKMIVIWNQLPFIYNAKILFIHKQTFPIQIILCLMIELMARFMSLNFIICELFLDLF